MEGLDAPVIRHGGQAFRPLHYLIVAAFEFFHKCLEILGHQLVLRRRTAYEVKLSSRGTKRVEVSEIILREEHVPPKFTSVDDTEPLGAKAELVVDVAIA